MNKKALFAGFAAGLAGGAAAALLNAPASGQETRKNLKNKQVSAKLASMEIKDNAGQVKESVKHLVQTAKQEVPEKVNSLKTNAALWKESIEPNVKTLQKEISNIQHTVEDLQETLPQPPGSGK
ncbi:YtxH domain-containing protein [Domibacillus sp. DTU_2020_1001157_1_SI_ALB_TIR_016]|uniref:YtxH domain-containing protein n=1 Tax=Domibacillus sp. DTU_2020_1001157_1_SI_ALB_TIR_016 TaxID=3077789 RepID=UPI0028F1489B|nr:YtxH domain-containing protein [Domibacillus sp. DTU_2020_1001157_1_SI_ALB_TIR_016]WNS80095.1 YtxH domain-containing protein [Domibacillus sp. DTU_2020_1001157_1_SI_ALB_TIR_016]